LTQAERIIDACHAALDAGPLGDKLRGPEYRRLISCGFAPALVAPFTTSDIGTIKTSCAVFARGILHAAGRPATRPGRVGQGIMGGWLEGLTTSHPAWEWAIDAQGKSLGRKPPPGALFYRDYSRQFSGLGHVGFLLFETTPGKWYTAEGGGGDGTECRLSAEPKDFFAKDSLNRIPVGWWRPELLDGFVLVPESPAPQPEPPQDAPGHRPVRLGDRDPQGSSDGPVRAWQRRLQNSGVPGTSLPRWGADGDFGNETLMATRALIAARIDAAYITLDIWNLAERNT
jgi:hypothetical protein